MIRVGFSHANGFWVFLSKAIMAVTGRPYSHCWLLLTGDHSIGGLDVVLTEDENGGLHFEPWVGYGVGKTIVTVLVPSSDLNPGYMALLNKLGEGYDYTGLLGEAYVEAMKDWFHRKVTNPLARASRMWCSESIYYVLMNSPGSGVPTNVSDQVDPGVVYDALVKSGASASPGYSLV